MTEWGQLINFSAISWREQVSRLTRRMPLVEQELLTLPEHLSSPPAFSGLRDTRSLVVCVCVVDRCLYFCPFPFRHCVVCSSSIYGLLLHFRVFKVFLHFDEMIMMSALF